MPRLLLGLFYLSYFTLQWQNSEGGEVTSKIMQLGDRLILTSPSFPSCCLDDFTYHVSLRCPSPCAFDILFIDVDLPETATLKVYTGMKAENNPIVTATYSENYGWTRPSQIHESLTNSITINSTVIPHQLLPQYSGVKVQIEVFNSVRQRKASITSVDVCKSVQSVRRWKGGEVKVTPVYSTSGIKHKVDCLWVLKQPEGASENMQVYVRFTYTDELHGLLAVRNGSNSEAKALFYVDTDNKDASEAAIMHGKEGFTSTGSLYVRLRKPSETGHLTFVYGLFYRLDKQDKADTSCDMNGKSDGGFFCAGSSWCIPKADWCDGVRHCPSGEDEKDCPVLPSTTTTTTTTQSTTPSTTSVRPTVARHRDCKKEVDRRCRDLTCAPKPRECPEMCYAAESTFCPDGTCHSVLCAEDCKRIGRRKCKDGSCSSPYDRCPRECPIHEKMCEDGTCVPQYIRCYDGCDIMFDKKCANGKCIPKRKKCAEDCTGNERLCPEYECVNVDYLCRDETCPSSQYQCGFQCYSEAEKCNYITYCEDGQDEQNCEEEPSTISPILVVVATIISVVVLAVCVIGCRKSRSRAPREMGASSRPVVTAGARPRPSPVTTRSVPAAVRHNPSNNTTSNTSAPDTTTSSTPLTQDPSAPPPYDEALRNAYDPPPRARPTEPLPPPYESVAATSLLHNDRTSVV